METKRVTEEMRNKLRAPLPKEAISKHPTKTYLSSIKGIFIVERLNDVFGVGSWKNPSKAISVSNEGMVVVYSQLLISEYGIELESFGGNDNGGEKSKNFDLGDAYKGACTDALSKMCSFLEIGIDVFKGNGNNPPKAPETPKQPEVPKQPETPKELILLEPSNQAFIKLTKWLGSANRTKEDWLKVKDGYKFVPETQNVLFQFMKWQ